MKSELSVSVIICAAGSGNRMQANIPKQFLLLHQKPVLYYSIQAFLQAFPDAEIIVGVHEDYLQLAAEIKDAYFPNQTVRFVVGGETRFHTVQNALETIEHVAGQDRVIMVHDAARPLVASEVIERVYHAAAQVGNAVPAIKPADSIRLLEAIQIHDTSQVEPITLQKNSIVNRNLVRLIQTPQAFISSLLKPAFDIAYKEQFTDEASVVEAFGIHINLVDGDAANIKLTTPNDWDLAEYLIQKNSKAEK